MLLLRGDDVLCGKSVLRCEDQTIGILIFSPNVMDPVCAESKRIARCRTA
jgi:hypothetical protein